jgi:hypothetical protein
LLLVHCGDHPVAECPRCGELIGYDKLAVEIASGRCDYCPVCQLDLTGPLRRHLGGCTWIRVQVHETHTRAWVLLEEARNAGKVSELRRDRADVLAREAEVERARSRNVKHGQNPDATTTTNAGNMQPAAADLIRAKLRIGQLPRRTATRTWISVGSHLPCDGCDEPIIAGDPQHEVDAIGLGTLRFHKQCMQLWEEASAMPRDIAGGSDALTLTLARVRVRYPVALSRMARERWMHQGRCAALAAAAVLIVTVGLLCTPPTSEVGRHDVSQKPAVTSEVASPAPLLALTPPGAPSPPLTPQTPHPRAAARTSSRHIHTAQMTPVGIKSRVSLPAPAANISAFATAQVLQAP